MSFEHKEGMGGMFRNQHKTSDKHPDYRGEARYKGELVEIAGWIKDGAKGKWMSLNLAPKDQGSQEGGSRSSDEGVPF